MEIILEKITEKNSEKIAEKITEKFKLKIQENKVLTNEQFETLMGEIYKKSKDSIEVCARILEVWLITKRKSEGKVIYYDKNLKEKGIYAYVPCVLLTKV